MADIRNFLKEKEKREKNQQDFRQKIQRHKLAAIYRFVLIFAVLAALAAFLTIQFKGHIYTGYDIISVVEREKNSGAVDIALKDRIVTYSKDGAHCVDSKGNVIWNQTYEIQDIKLAVNQDVIAIGNYNGREIYLQNTQGILGTVNTTMPIRDIAVSANGYVTAVLADTDITWVNTYDSSGELKSYAKTSMKFSGYPGAISLSPDGKMLMVAYAYVDAGELKTNVAFYNFGPVGDNASDYIVGVFVCADMLVPEVGFLDKETSYAVGDSQLKIYKGSQKPMQAANYLFDREVLSVFSGEGHLGLVFDSEEPEYRYKLNVYNTAAEREEHYYFNINYTDILFTQDNIIIYNERECVIFTYDGVEKFNGTFSENVNLLIPTNAAYRFILVTNDAIETIQLR